MRRCQNRFGLLWQRRREETGEALTWRVRRSFVKGKMGHRAAPTEVAREESEKPEEAEMEVDGGVPQKEYVEFQSPTRKVIRVESEETQDNVREILAISQAEAEEMGFVPSALGEPRGPISGCDNRCSEKTIRYWQIASMVVVVKATQSICVSSATMKS